MSSLKINFEGMERKEIAEELRAQLKRYDDNPLATWRWWSGFLWGALLIAIMDYGDVWICVGQCENKQTQQTVQYND